MPFRKTFLTAVCAASALIGTAATATAEANAFYLCRMANQEVGSWISPDIGVVFDERGQVTVIDDVTQHFHRGPRKAQTSRSAGKVRVAWTIANPVDNKGQRLATMSYLGNLNLKNRSFSVVVKPVGQPQRWSGKGRCEVRRKK